MSENTNVKEEVMEQEANNTALESFDFGADLDAEFSEDLATEIAEKEKDELSQNLEGFASCFPNWDLHPPKK